MKRSVTTATIASVGAAALALMLGSTTATAEAGTTAKLGEQKAEHGYGGYGQPRYGGQGHRGGHDNHRSHNNGYRGYQPHGNQHRAGGHGGHGAHAGHGNPRYRNHEYGWPWHSSRGYSRHRNYYCSHCNYRTTSYSIFYNHVHHHHHVPWYDIGALIVFDPINLFFTFGGHGGHHGYADHH
jgi:hypothetical protein